MKNVFFRKISHLLICLAVASAVELQAQTGQQRPAPFFHAVYDSLPTRGGYPVGFQIIVRDGRPGRIDTSGYWWDGNSWRKYGESVADINVEESDVPVLVGLDTLDFGAGFDLELDGDDEVNIVLDYRENPVDLSGLGGAEVINILPARFIGVGLTNKQIDDNISIDQRECGTFYLDRESPATNEGMIAWNASSNRIWVGSESGALEFYSGPHTAAGIDVEEGGTQIVDQAVVVNYGPGFDVASSAGPEATITLDYSEKQVDLSGTDVTGFLAAGRFPALAGNLTNTAGSLSITINDNAVTYARMQDFTVTQRLNGRNTSGGGDPEEVTVTQVLDWIGATQGSVIYRGASTWSALTPGTAGTFLQSQGTGANPVWASSSMTITVREVDGSPSVSTATLEFDATDGFVVSNNAGAAKVDLASVPLSVLATSTSGYIPVANVSGVWTGVAMSGDVAISNAGATTIQDNSVDGSDLQLASEVTNRMMYYDGGDWSVTNTPSSGNTLIANGTGVPTFVAVSGDVTNNSSGVFTIANDAVTSAKILDATIATGDLANDAVTYAKIQNITDNRLLGRSAGSSGDMMEITLGSGLTLSSGVLTRAAVDVITVAEVDGAPSVSSGTIKLDQADGFTVTDVGGGVVQIDLSGIPLDRLSTFASSDLSSKLTDETGSGTVVFNTAPTFSGATFQTTDVTFSDYAELIFPTIGGTHRITPRNSGFAINAPSLSTLSILGGGAGSYKHNLHVEGDITSDYSISGINLSGTNTGDQTITLTGDVTGSGTGSFAATIASGVIVNADINASAAIALSKLASGTSAHLVVANGSGVWTGVAMSGDATISNAGAIDIAADAVSYDELQNISATQRVLGRNSAGSGDVQEVTIGQLLDWLGTTTGSMVIKTLSGWTILAPGSDGQRLEIVSGIPTWVTP